MYIAKLVTRYPEFHGSGYFNFIVESDKEVLESKVEEMGHDFYLAGSIMLDIEQDELLDRYPTKYELDKEFL